MRNKRKMRKLVCRFSTGIVTRLPICKQLEFHTRFARRRGGSVRGAGPGTGALPAVLSQVIGRSPSLGQVRYGRSAYAGRRRLTYHEHGFGGEMRVVISRWPLGRGQGNGAM